jgi:hypothetical protein
VQFDSALGGLAEPELKWSELMMRK